MKKMILLACSIATVAIFWTTNVNAQRFAYIDSEYILNNIPEYQEAQKELDAQSAVWQQQIEAKYAEIDRLYKAYQAEQILLTEEQRRKREQEIITKEKEAKDFQKSKFGVDGELFKKRQELVKPIQDKIYTALDQIATTNTLAIIFDKSGQSNMIYTNPKYDKSDEVLKKLGYKGGTE